MARYKELLATGLAASPPPPRPPHHRPWLKQSPARNLLEWLWLGRDEVLAFLDDLAIPSDNIQAERGLRMLKVHQKVSGCFRSDAGAACPPQNGLRWPAALFGLCSWRPRIRAVVSPSGVSDVR